MKILYIVEPMLGIGPNIDANLIAKHVGLLFKDKIDIKIILEKDNFLKYTSSNISWVRIEPWRFNFSKNVFEKQNGKAVYLYEKRKRALNLIQVYKNYNPDVIILHNYMSGSKWDSIIDFEMIPLIEYAKNYNKKIKIYSYMIGMLDGFESILKEDINKFIKSVLKNIDKVFIRSDNLKLFLKTCPPAKLIKHHFMSIGYSVDINEILKNHNGNTKFILVSAGGGDSALHLFKVCLLACKYVSEIKIIKNIRWKFFVGPMQEKNLNLLKEYSNKLKCTENVEFIVGADENLFLSYLKFNCLFSISQCGQRTFTNLEITNAKSILVPRESDGKEYEQLYRALYLLKIKRAFVIRESDLSLKILIKTIKKVLKHKPSKIGLNLNGPNNMLKSIIKLGVK